MINKVGFIHVYNKIAPLYDSVFGRGCHDAYELVLEIVEKYGMNFNSLLDIGCGTGSLLNYISSDMNISQLYGIDPSENMIKIAKKKNINRCKFYIEPIESISLPDNSIDCVVNTTAFSHFSNVGNAMSQIHRVLKKTGYCIIVEHKKPKLYVERFLKKIRILANYLGYEEIKDTFTHASFKILELRETKKYIVAIIVPIEKKSQYEKGFVRIEGDG